MVQGYERKNKEAQNNVFKGDQTKDHFLSYEELIFGLLSFHFIFSIFPQPIFCLLGFCFCLPFFGIFFAFPFALHSYFQQGMLKLFFLELNSFLMYFLFSLRSDHSSFETILFWYLPLDVEGDSWSGFRKKITKLKRGSNWIFFYQ